MNVNVKKMGIKIGYEQNREEIPTGCPFDLGSSDRRTWLEGWGIGLNLAEKHRHELHQMLESGVIG